MFKHTQALQALVPSPPYLLYGHFSIEMSKEFPTQSDLSLPQIQPCELLHIQLCKALEAPELQEQRRAGDEAPDQPVTWAVTGEDSSSTVSKSFL